MPKHVTETTSPFTTVSSSLAAISSSTGRLSASDAAAPTDAVNVQTLTRAGFLSRVDNSMSFNTGTRALSIGPTGSAFYVWSANTKYTYNSPQTTTVGTASGQWFVYFNSAGVLTSSQSPWSITSDQAAPVSLIYWAGNGAISGSGTYADERHGAYRDRYNHSYLHNTRGTAYDNGLAGTFTTTTISITAGAVWDEDIKFDITGTTTTCNLWYRVSGANGMSMSFEPNVTAPAKLIAGVPYYDSSGTLTACGNGNFVNYWVYASTDFSQSIQIVLGQANYANLAAAQAGAQPSFPNMTTREWKLLYQVIYGQAGGAGSYNSAVDYRTVSALPGASVPTTLPAGSVTFAPVAPLSGTNVQTALSQTANIATKVFGGLFGDYGLAVSGGAGDPTMVVASGVFTAISASLTSAPSSTNGLCSASIADGRVYVSAGGTFLVHADTSLEFNANTITHIGIFVTGTEVPRFSQANDQGNGNTDQMSVSALVPLVSGNYVDVRVRAGTGGTYTVHHFNFEVFRLAPEGL